MFFDTLAGIVERHLPDYIGMMSKAKIFRMESKKSTMTAGEAVSKWEPDERTIENFRLPFPVIALEEAADRNGNARRCIVLSVLNAEKRHLRFLIGNGASEPMVVSVGELTAMPDVEQSIDDRLDRILDVTYLKLWEGDKRHGLRQLPVNALTVRDYQATRSKAREHEEAGKGARVFLNDKWWYLDEVESDPELLKTMIRWLIDRQHGKDAERKPRHSWLKSVRCTSRARCQRQSGVRLTGRITSS